MRKHLANILTGGRILGSVVLLFLPAFSPWFYVTYLLCGFSDMIDGTVARKTNSTSSFGSRLDTVADLVFLAVSFAKLLPQIHIPRWLWIWCCVIAVMKIGNILWGYASAKRFLALHTVMNKITGLLLFLLPLTMALVEVRCSSVVICAIATIAAIQEGVYVITGRGCA